MRQPTQFGKFLTIVLGLLLVVFMTAEVAHQHDTGTGDPLAATHCQLCAIAHVGTVSQPAWLTAHVLHLIATVQVGDPLPASRPVIRTSRIRPPPAVDPALV